MLAFWNSQSQVDSDELSVQKFAERYPKQMLLVDGLSDFLHDYSTCKTKQNKTVVIVTENWMTKLRIFGCDVMDFKESFSLSKP